MFLFDTQEVSDAQEVSKRTSRAVTLEETTRKTKNENHFFYVQVFFKIFEEFQVGLSLSIRTIKFRAKVINISKIISEICRKQY